MAFTEDLTAFFDTSDFAITATVGGSSVNGILDSEFVEVGDVEAARPVFMCASSDVPSVTHGTTVVASGTTYKVIGIEPDGTGITQLYLQEQ